jgi:hypothetical protein
MLSCDATLDEDCMQSIMASGIFLFFFLSLENMLSCDAALDEDCVQSIMASGIFLFFLIFFSLWFLVFACPL